MSRSPKQISVSTDVDIWVDEIIGQLSTDDLEEELKERNKAVSIGQFSPKDEIPFLRRAIRRHDWDEVNACLARMFPEW